MIGKLAPAALLLLVLAGCAQSTPQVSSAASAEKPVVTPVAQAVGCPATRQQYPAGPATTMVPGTPGAVTVCRYGPQPTLSLLRSATLTAGPGLSQLVSKLNAPFDTTPDGVHWMCPMDDGQVDVLLFAYPSGPPVAVTVKQTGCQTASNGTYSVRFYGKGAEQGSHIQAQLSALVGTARPGATNR